MFVSPPHGEDGSQALGEQPPSLLPAVTALEMPPPPVKGSRGSHTHTAAAPPPPPAWMCWWHMGCEGPPPTIPLQLYNHGDSVSCSGTYIWGDSWQGRTPPPLLSTLEPPKTVEGGDPIAPTLHPPPS